MKHRSMPWALLVGGGIAGALDILFAIAFAGYNVGVSPERVLQVVASGALGEAAFSGGTPVAALGLLLHFLLSFAWAGLFLLAAVRAPGLMHRPLVSGIAFGIVVFLMMRCVVLPLSALPFSMGFEPFAAGMDLLSHMFLFGVPIALAACTAVTKAA